MNNTSEHNLEILRDKVLILGGQTETAFVQATRALIHRDSILAQTVIDEDDDIDLIESQIDQLCVDILHTNKPSPKELRFIIGIARTTPVIERIADHAVNIARHTLKLNDEPQLKPYLDLPRMVEIVHQMLMLSIDALAQNNSIKAREIIKRDKEVDLFYTSIFDELLSYMATDPSYIVRAAEMLFVIKHLERIGDYITNICEQIVYMAEGRNIKHTVEAR